MWNKDHRVIRNLTVLNKQLSRHLEKIPAKIQVNNMGKTPPKKRKKSTKDFPTSAKQARQPLWEKQGSSSSTVLQFFPVLETFPGILLEQNSQATEQHTCNYLLQKLILVKNKMVSFPNMGWTVRRRKMLGTCHCNNFWTPECSPARYTCLSLPQEPKQQA